MPNDVLLSMAVAGDQSAKEERLIREIMVQSVVIFTHAYYKFIVFSFSSL
jgi:hypothetical protein